MLQHTLAIRAPTNSADNSELPRHRWYPIKEGFSAKLVSDAIAEAQESHGVNVTAIEPFSGSGTSPVECARHGIRCTAYEVNPFLAFVGQTKLEHATVRSFIQFRKQVLNGLHKPVTAALERYSTFCEGDGKKKWLFNRAVLRSFAGGWRTTINFPRSEKALCQLALLRAAMDNCNAYPDGKCLRYKRLATYDCFTAQSVISQFEKHCETIKEDLASCPFDTRPASIQTMDARKLSSHKIGKKFDLCVTSPPYLNSFDYSDVYRPELFLGGFVTSNADLMKVRLRTVRSHLQANWKSPVRNAFGSLYAKVLNQIEANRDALWSERIPEMIQAYFEDIERLLKALKLHANKAAKLKVAVATSAYGGVVIPVDLIIADVAEKVGWLLRDVQVVRRLRSSGQLWKHEDSQSKVPELRESIVILDRP